MAPYRRSSVSSGLRELRELERLPIIALNQLVQRIEISRNICRRLNGYPDGVNSLAVSRPL